MSDPLDRIASGKMSKEQKREYAARKKDEEEKNAMTDRATVNKTSKEFRDHVEKERRRLGLSKKQPTTMFCENCFRMNCICEEG